MPRRGGEIEWEGGTFRAHNVECGLEGSSGGERARNGRHVRADMATATATTVAVESEARVDDTTGDGVVECVVGSAGNLARDRDVGVVADERGGAEEADSRSSEDEADLAALRRGRARYIPYCGDAAEREQREGAGGDVTTGAAPAHSAAANAAAPLGQALQPPPPALHTEQSPTDVRWTLPRRPGTDFRPRPSRDPRRPPRHMRFPDEHPRTHRRPPLCLSCSCHALSRLAHRCCPRLIEAGMLAPLLLGLIDASVLVMALVLERVIFRGVSWEFAAMVAVRAVDLAVIVVFAIYLIPLNVISLILATLSLIIFVHTLLDASAGAPADSTASANYGAFGLAISAFLVTFDTVLLSASCARGTLVPRCLADRLGWQVLTPVGADDLEAQGRIPYERISHLQRVRLQEVELEPTRLQLLAQHGYVNAHVWQRAPQLQPLGVDSTLGKRPVVALQEPNGIVYLGFSVERGAVTEAGGGNVAPTEPMSTAKSAERPAGARRRDDQRRSADGEVLPAGVRWSHSIQHALVPEANGRATNSASDLPDTAAGHTRSPAAPDIPSP